MYLKDSTRYLTRWRLRPLQFAFMTKRRPGTRHQAPDATLMLFRNTDEKVPDPVDQDTQTLYVQHLENVSGTSVTLSN